MKIFARTRAAIGRMTVGARLYIAFAAVLVLTAALGGASLLGLNRVSGHADELADKWLQGVGQLAQARPLITDARDHEIKHSRTADRSYHAEYEEKLNKAVKEASAALAAYQGMLGSAKERQLFDRLSKGWASYQQAQQKVVGLGRDKKQQDAADISDGLASMAFDETLGALSALFKYNFEQAALVSAETKVLEARTGHVVQGMLAAALLVGMGLAYAITRNLIGQLGGEPRVAAAVAQAVALGDLTTPIRLRAGDTSSLMASLQGMQSALARTVTHVRGGSESVAMASTQIAQGNQDLSNRTEQQASALEETAATMDQLGATVRTNADNARQADQFAQGASAVAIRGGDVVGQVVETMKGINDSSKKIVDIIGVIDGIAFQTNILALNAAVEAARAGEQGRGFAVVASEVRNLASRSADAAKQIKGLIGTSVQRVEDGTKLVDRAGDTMKEIVASIRRVTDIMGEISAASAEQSSGVAQVGQAVAQMDQATQQNAALVEESAAAAESLMAQARSLVEAVAVFKVA